MRLALHGRWLSRSVIAAVLITFGLVVPAVPASAATITVTTTLDEFGTGPGCSVREAAESANTDTAFGGCATAGSGADILSIPAGVHRLSIEGTDENDNVDGDIDLTDPAGVTIVGAGMDATFVDGNGPVVGERVFDVREGDATFEDLSVRNGDGRQFGQRGGGIFFHASGYLLTINDSSVHKNDAYRGGGVAVGNGDATIVRSEIANNTANYYGDGDGGGIYVNEGFLTLQDSLVANNHANDYGGGIKAWGEGVLIQRSTITGNSATWGDGGGLWLQPPNVLEPLGARGTAQALDYVIEDSTISANSIVGDFDFIDILDTVGTAECCYFDGGGGGGLFVECCGPIDILRSTFNDNSAAVGGGIFNNSGGRILVAPAVPIEGNGTYLENSTISSNYARFAGGGVFDNGSVFMVHTTVYRNEAEEAGGGLLDATLNTTVHLNSIIAANLHEDCVGGFSLGYNVLGDGSCDVDVTDIAPVTDGGFDVDPRLAPLRDNGGPTKTHALLPGSEAIDLVYGDPGCPPPATDQRGVPRPTGALCDSGAYEVGELEEEPEPPEVLGEVIERDFLCRGLVPTILGTGAADVLVGTSGPDVIQGLSGNDRIRGKGGDDVICGARGNDLMKGGRGDDILKGLRGDDRYRAGSGRDLCIPGPGEDDYRGCEAPPQTV